MTTSKAWYTSKTLWFNIISLIVAIIGQLLDSKLLVNANVVTIFGTVITVGNIILRALSTSQPITGTPAGNKADVANGTKGPGQ